MQSGLRVAHIKVPYLPASETFIYELITGVNSAYPGIVITAKEMKNLDRFPFPEIHHFDDFEELPQLLEEKGVGLIHGHFGVGGTRVLKAKKSKGLPLLTSFHGVDVFALPYKSTEYRENLRALFEEGEMFTAVSQFMADALKELGCTGEKIRIFHCGINLDKFPFEPREFPADNKLRILSVGRLKEKKGMPVLIEAFALIRKEFPQAELTIIGEGGQRKRLEQLIKDLSLVDCITLTGELSHREVALHFRNTHVFSLASLTAPDGDREGIPVVLMEAMAAGVPVVSTRHSGIPELISEGVSGLLAREGDSRDLADALLKLLGSAGTWPEMVREARKKVESEFNIKVQVPRLEKIYRSLLSADI